MARRGLRIVSVHAGSVARRAGFAPGDEILTINDREIPDQLALRFHQSADFLDIRIRKPNGVEKLIAVDMSEPDLGVEVEDFRTRTCANACIFCFVDQLPPGVRPGLCVKDDDYRLSFLHGNYVTLTNVADRDLERIVDERLSPLYVSVHATDPGLRARMLGRKKTDDLDRKLRKLIRGGVRIHAQVVLVPGINDGAMLEKTVFDLRALHPGLQSVAIVPLGLSDHGRHKSALPPITSPYSRRLVRMVAPWQQRFHRETGEAFAYLADEFYLQGGVAIPEKEHYGDFTQIEDGVGMVRNFLDEFDREMRRRRKRLPRLNGTLATGTLFFPILNSCAMRFNEAFGSNLRVRAARNRFMGKRITVAGLLGGADFIRALWDDDLGDFVIIPQEAVSRAEGVLIDDLSIEDLALRLGRPVYPGGRTVHDLFDLLFDMNPEQSPRLLRDSRRKPAARQATKRL